MAKDSIQCETYQNSQRYFTMPNFNDPSIRYRVRSPSDQCDLVRAKLEGMSRACDKQRLKREASRSDKNVEELSQKISALITSEYTKKDFIEDFYKQNSINPNLVSAITKLSETETLQPRQLSNLVQLALVIAEREAEPLYLLELILNNDHQSFHQELLRQIKERDHVSEQFIQTFAEYCIDSANHEDMPRDFYELLASIYNPNDREKGFRSLESICHEKLSEKRIEYKKLVTNGYKINPSDGALIVESTHEDIAKLRKEIIDLNKFLINLYEANSECLQIQDLRNFFRTNYSFPDLPKYIQAGVYHFPPRPFDHRLIGKACTLINDMANNQSANLTKENLVNLLTDIASNEEGSSYPHELTRKLCLDTLIKLGEINTVNAISESLIKTNNLSAVYSGITHHNDEDRIVQLAIAEIETAAKPNILALLLITISSAKMQNDNEQLKLLGIKAQSIISKILSSNRLDLAASLKTIAKFRLPDIDSVGIASYDSSPSNFTIQSLIDTLTQVPGIAKSNLSLLNIVTIFSDKAILENTLHNEFLDDVLSGSIQSRLDDDLSPNLEATIQTVRRLKSDIFVERQQRNAQYQADKTRQGLPILESISSHAMTDSEIEIYYEEILKNNTEIRERFRVVLATDTINDLASKNLSKLLLVAAKDRNDIFWTACKSGNFGNKFQALLADRDFISEATVVDLTKSFIDNGSYKVETDDYYKVKLLVDITYPYEPERAFEFIKTHALKKLEELRTNYITSLNNELRNPDALVIEDGEVDTNRLQVTFDSDDLRTSKSKLISIQNFLIILYGSFPQYLQEQDMVDLLKHHTEVPDAPQRLDSFGLFETTTLPFKKESFSKLLDLIVFLVKNYKFDRKTFTPLITKQIFAKPDHTEETEIKRLTSLQAYRRCSNEAAFSRIIAAMLRDENPLVNTPALKYFHDLDQIVEAINNELDRTVNPKLLSIVLSLAIKDEKHTIYSDPEMVRRNSEPYKILLKLFSKPKLHRKLREAILKLPNRLEPSLKYLLKFARENEGTQVALNIYQAINDYRLLKPISHLFTKNIA